MSSFSKHRKSIRLVGYDYSKAGLYFVTICCQNKECFFGEIVFDEMILNEAGKIANECWFEIPKHFKNVVLHDHIIMPNHVHGIIEITTDDVWAIQQSQKDIVNNVKANIDTPLRNTFKSPSKTIGSIIRGYKIGVTKWFHSNTDILNVWQRNYFEHIIRDDDSYQRISNYINNNPKNWKDDKFFH